MYHVYIIECADGSLYTGITTDVARRFKEHQDGAGGRYTRSREVVRVVYTQKHPNRSSALKREVEIKKWRSDKKRLFVYNSGHMAKRLNHGLRNKKSHSRKTTKRLATKRAMLQARKKK